MLPAIINGKLVEVEDGSSILDAIRAANAKVPTLCYDDRLKPYGGCRLCIVKVEGIPKPVTSCNTPLEAGMVIATHSPEIERLRKTLLHLLAENYPARKVDQFPEKEFHRYLREYGVDKRFVGAGLQDREIGQENILPDESHPYIHIDMSQCIYCYRCVRICEEVQGQFVWKVWNRGDATRILPDSGGPLLESSCVSCGACVDTCPTGALEDKSILKMGMPTSWTTTTCPYCGTGCAMDVGTIDNRMVSIRPVLDSPVSQGHLCVKGRYASGFVYARDRITKPMIRKGDQWSEVSWDDAIEFVSKRLSSIVERYGPDSVGVLGSARSTNEENYLAQKFARTVTGTNNVDCCARVCHAPTAAAMKAMLGAGAATNSYADIEKARTILLCGANATENHPIVGARIKQAALKGALLIVIDPRRIELCEFADIHLAPRPGTNILLLNSMAHTIVRERLFDEEFIAARVADWDEYREFILRFAPDKVAAECGVREETIRQAARLYATKKPAICFHGLGMTEHVQGTEGVMCLVNLALLTGNIGLPGAGINPLRGQNNVQGAAHMGCEPKNLTGAVPLDEGRELCESVWGSRVPAAAGLNLMEMMDAAATGDLKALWAIGYDFYLTNANATATARSLENMELVVVQDMFLNETAKRFGTVFLPAASTFEKDGTFMNAERRIQRVRRVIEPLGYSKSDWEIICLVAKAMGRGELFNFQSAEEIWNEVRAVWKAGRGITYSRLGTRGLQWPCPSTDHPGTSVLHTDAFSIGGRAPLRRIEYRPTPEKTTEEYPFLLITGRTLYHFNAGTMTMRTANIALRDTDYVEVSTEDAARLGLKEGQHVRLRSRYGIAELPVKITSAVKPGELFSTFHSPEVFLNYVTGPHRDSYVESPEFKVTACRIELLK